MDSDMSHLFKGIIGSVVRYCLGGATLYVAQKGIITGDQSVALLEAAVLGAVTLTWAIWRKYKIRERINTALELPAGTSTATLDRVVEEKKEAADLPASRPGPPAGRPPSGGY